MPKIPSFKENQRLEQGSPVQAESVDAAGREGEIISQFGNSLANLGKAFSMKKESENNMFGRRVKAQARVASQRAMIQARQSPTLAQDGSNLQDEFDAAYNKNTADLVKSFSSENSELGFTVLSEVGSLRKETLLATELGMFETKIDLDAESSEENMVSGIQADPENADQYIQDHADFIDSTHWNEAKKSKVIDEGSEVIPKAQISGYLNQNNFKSAYKVLESDGAKGLSQKERDAEFSRIESTQNSRYNQTQKVMNDTRIKRDRELKEKQLENFSKLMTDLAVVNTPEGYQALLTNSTASLKNQGISVIQWKAAQSPNARVTPAEDDESLGRYVIRLFDKKEQSMDAMISDLTADKAAGLITSGTYASIVGMINKKKARRKSLPSSVLRELRNNEQSLKTIIGKGVRKDAFGNPQLNFTQSNYLRQALNTLSDAAENGGSARLEQAYNTIVGKMPIGDVALIKVPPGVATKEIRSRGNVDRAMESRANRLRKLFADGVPKNDRRVRDLVRQLDGLERYKDAFEEREEAKKSGPGDGIKRKR